MIRLLTICFLCLAGLTAGAQNKMTSNDTLEVYFRQGLSRWEPSFIDNGKDLDAFISRFNRIMNDSLYRKCTKIAIYAGCSPEGLWEYNQQLSRNRISSIKQVLLTEMELPDSLLTERAIGINWQALRDMVQADPDVPHREEVLDIIDNTPELYTDSDGKTIELRKLRLRWRFDGKAWEYMYERFFPAMRSFNLQIVVDWRELDINRVEHSIKSQAVVQQAETAIKSYPPPLHSEQKPHKSAYASIRTNLLYDAALTPNIGAEFYLGRGFSLIADWHYAWWNDDSIKWYHRTYGGDIGVRYWFGSIAKEKPLTGHHIGIYGQVFTYDFEFGHMGIIGGKPNGTLFDQPNFGAGLDYGYSFPLANRLNLDLSVGMAYHWGIYYEYLPVDDCYVWKATKRRNYWGPTKAEVSLVWLLGKDNINKSRKGGRR